MTRPTWIRTSYEDPPIPAPGFWRAWDDRLGADDSPYGQGETEEQAIDGLLVQLDCNESWEYMLDRAGDIRGGAVSSRFVSAKPAHYNSPKPAKG